MEYDIIGRLEDYHEDILYIAQLRNLTSKLGDLSEVSLSIWAMRVSSLLELTQVSDSTYKHRQTHVVLNESENVM